jgi:hypothetical protein
MRPLLVRPKPLQYICHFVSTEHTTSSIDRPQNLSKDQHIRSDIRFDSIGDLNKVHGLCDTGSWLGRWVTADSEAVHAGVRRGPETAFQYSDQNSNSDSEQTYQQHLV